MNELDSPQRGTLGGVPIRALATLLALVFVYSGCELSSNFEDESDPPIDDIVYSQHVQPILDRRCTACHAGAQAAAGLDLTSWLNLIAGSDFGEAIVPFDPTHSRALAMASRLAGGSHPSERGSDTLTTAEFELLERWVDEGAADDTGLIPFADADQLLYVCNQEEASVSVIDMETNVVIRRVDLVALGFAPSAKPHHAAVAPDGSHWYVTLIGENKVLKLTRENELVGQADFETPGMIAVSSGGETVYVARSLSAASPPASIGKIDAETMEVQAISVVFPRPHALAIAPGDSLVYTASLGQNVLMVVRPGSADVEFTAVAGDLHAFVQHAVTLDGSRLFSSGQLTNKVLVFDTTDPESLRPVGEIDVGPAPWHPVISKDGETLYVGNKDANTVTVISVSGLSVESVISGDGLSVPHGSAVSPDDDWVYISSRNTSGDYTPRHDLGDNEMIGTVAVISRVTGDIVKVLEVGTMATGLGARP